MADPQLPPTPPLIDKDKIAEVAKNVLGTAVTGVLDPFLGMDLANTPVAELERAVREEVLPGLETATRAELTDDPKLALVGQDFRDRMADAVAPVARARSEQELARFEFGPVDPGKSRGYGEGARLATRRRSVRLISTDADGIVIDLDTQAQGKAFSAPFSNSFSSGAEAAGKLAAQTADRRIAEHVMTTRAARRRRWGRSRWLPWSRS